jgi:hypothetical protein
MAAKRRKNAIYGANRGYAPREIISRLCFSRSSPPSFTKKMTFVTLYPTRL